MDVVTLTLAKNYTNQRIAEIASGFVYKGAVNYRADLDNIAAEIGHIYTVKYKGTSGTTPWNAEFVYGNYEGSNTWIELGPDYEADIAALKTGKQDKLIVGTNIKIEDNKISAEAGQLALEGTSGTLTAEQLALLANKSVNILRDTKIHRFSSSSSTSSGELRTYDLIIDNNVCPMYHYILVNMLSGVWNAYTTNLQDKLTAGANITIDETTHTISATGGGTGYFLAEYNKTTFADVLAAYNAGKIIDVKAAMTGIGDVSLHLKFVQLTNDVPTCFYFNQLLLDASNMTVSIDAGGWHSTQIELERELVAGSAVGFDSELGTARTINVKYDDNTIKVNSDGKLYTTTAGTSVIANPTLSGGEAELTSIQIGNTKYSNLNYHPFPDAFVTNKTLKEFGQSIVGYANFATGCTWFGGIQCTDLPGGMIQVECKVTAIRDTVDFVRNIAVVEIYSSEVAPFYWTYNTDSWDEGTGLDDWKYMAAIDGSKLDSSAVVNVPYDVKVRKVNAAAGSKGWEFYTDKHEDELPAYPTDTDGEYILALKYVDGAWVKYWKEIANKSDIVDKGTVDYMVIKQ